MKKFYLSLLFLLAMGLPLFAQGDAAEVQPIVYVASYINIYNV